MKFKKMVPHDFCPAHYLKVLLWPQILIHDETKSTIIHYRDILMASSARWIEWGFQTTRLIEWVIVFLSECRYICQIRRKTFQQPKLQYNKAAATMILKESDMTCNRQSRTWIARMANKTKFTFLVISNFITEICGMDIMHRLENTKNTAILIHTCASGLFDTRFGEIVQNDSLNSRTALQNTLAKIQPLSYFLQNPFDAFLLLK